jgi:hypothetical protein
LSLTLYPFNLLGRIDSRPMPFSLYDLRGSAGLGLMALIVMLLARFVLEISGAAVIEWLGRRQPGALLTPAHNYGDG